MRFRVKRLVLATDKFGRPPVLLAIAVILIAIFTVSLAVAEPGVAEPNAVEPQFTGSIRVLAARGNDVVTLGTPNTDGSLANDSISDDEAAILSAPLAAPHYHDRYRFYHRYDLYSPRSRFNPLDDGVN